METCARYCNEFDMATMMLRGFLLVGLLLALWHRRLEGQNVVNRFCASIYTADFLIPQATHDGTWNLLLPFIKNQGLPCVGRMSRRYRPTIQNRWLPSSRHMSLCAGHYRWVISFLSTVQTNNCLETPFFKLECATCFSTSFRNRRLRARLVNGTAGACR